MKKSVLQKMLLRSMFLAFVVTATFFLTGFAENNEVSQGKMIVVTVEEGESLWLIAGKYSKGGQDIRKFVYEIREVNELGRTVAIYPGQQLKIPLNE